MDYSPPGFSVHGILQARILEWLPFPPLVDLPDSVLEPTSLMSFLLQADPLPLHYLNHHHMGSGPGFVSPDFVTLGRLSKHLVLTFLINQIGLITPPVVVTRTKCISTVKLSKHRLIHST